MLKDSTLKLYLRWVQFGVFSPIFRLHSTNKAELDRRPWGKPERYFHAARDAMQLRHALIPYIYSMAWRAHQTGISLVTPMYYGDNSNASAFKAQDQYYFGSELIAAPVIAPSDPKTGFAVKRVWFPPGVWTNFFTGEQVAGGEWRDVHAGLEDIPVYAKAGAIIPLAPKVSWGGIENPTELDIYIFPGADREASPKRGAGDNSFDLYIELREFVSLTLAKTFVRMLQGCIGRCFSCWCIEQWHVHYERWDRLAEGRQRSGAPRGCLLRCLQQKQERIALNGSDLNKGGSYSRVTVTFIMMGCSHG